MFAANAVRTTIRQHATLSTALSFAIVAQLANLGVDAASSINQGFGAVPKRVIRTKTVETTTLSVAKYLASIFGVGQGRPQ